MLKDKIKESIQNNNIYFIAELGQNHQGDINIAKKMVDSLVGTGVSAIKTAKRDIDTCLTEEQKSMPYINPNSFGDTYYEHRKALELSKDNFKELKEYSESKGFDFISSFTDLNSLDFLNETNVKYLKIASQRLADIPLLKETAKTKKPIIISSGMSVIPDIDIVINIFRNNEKYLLQCTSSYPCNETDINLNVISNYKTRYELDVNGFGLSGHHTSIAPDLAAYMMGIQILERHYTLNNHWKGTDHSLSLSKRGIELIMKYIQQMKDSMGNYNKEILECELPAIKKLRG